MAADLGAIEADLAGGVGPDRIVQCLLKAFEGRLSTAVFFVFDQGKARAREGFSPSGELRFTDGFSVALEAPSLLHKATERKAPVLEPATAAGDGLILSRLGLGPGSRCAAVPFALSGTVFAGVWGCLGNLPDRPRLAAELSRISELGGQAFARLSRTMAPAR